MDDCLSGENSLNDAKEVTDSLQIVFNKGGFRFKRDNIFWISSTRSPR